VSTNPLAPFLQTPGVALLDGGLATELERRGAVLNDALWSARLLLDAPDLIREVHLAYLEAGADVIATASYQASVEGFARRGLDESAVRSLIRLSVDLATAARDRFWSDPANRWERHRPLVAGSIGPFGAALADGSEYHGNYVVSRAGLTEFHGPRLETLAESAADLVALETFPGPDEVLVLLELLARWPGRQAWVSFSCRGPGHTGDGTPIEEAVAAVMQNGQVAAVGVNCIAPEHADGLLRGLAAATGKPLVVYPNNGECWNAGSRTWTAGGRPFNPEVDGPRWIGLGARLIGGCCRTTPETIRRLRAAVLKRVPQGAAQ
jgi:homocysteine S-methyltransferase